ncbi:MAG: type IV toxin-antitoxin system AbiEi family antitoxin domain-containing protein, partial [Coriobacteriales bacterium]|nr:type IV toxin-antitoxin system AbiEi family antitoxin domain-containing protein [Coriobacteriales bacterium]
MKSLEALQIIQRLSSSQWGLFTAAQAVARGVNRVNLMRLEQGGHIERVQSGIYRSSAAPTTRLDYIYAAWLSLDPKLLSYERSKQPADDAVVFGATASYVLEIGELAPEPLTFSSPVRRQPRNSNIKVITRIISDTDIRITHGLPVAKPERTIADLAAQRTDLSLMRNVCKDAWFKYPDLDKEHLIDLLKPYAKTYGFGVSNGKAFAECLVD